TVDPDSIEPTVNRIRTSHRIRLLGEHEIAFDEPMQLLFMMHERLPRHSNGMRFTALGTGQRVLREADYYSIGGGFVVRGDEAEAPETRAHAAPPYPFASGEDLLRLSRDHGLELYELMLANEHTWASPAEVRTRLLHLWEVMQACVARGFRQTGLLPGVLKVRRRAPRLYRMLTESGTVKPLDVMDWVNAYALAVNEENAAGGRVVTAPTNGAAGIVPAVLHYYRRFEEGANEEGVIRFLLVAAAMGILYKKNASISGAEMGCQGEVGVACSMAAAGLVAALQGTTEQIENAAEIGMEHNLGLTCDPVAGLVQIPCIERNAMGAVKAINAARLAMRGDGSHKVSLDQVIATMRQTGVDMSTIYKETSQGGLAVNVPEC
ncbi:MAG TPA: L-serine ammonia-lyase, partial [Steroidobacteraceae bacterium]|nr:L-serine ammonia-lyase [Steroidobacteraceae bacterium]